MDPITASIIGALLAGVLTGFTEIGKTATYDAYTKLKGILNKKFGASSGVMQAVAHLEDKPDSPARQGVLHEEVAAANAWQDAEVLAAARHLQTLVQQQNISLRGSSVGGSINQVGGNQFQVDAGGLVGPSTRRGARRVISVLLIIGGLLVSIPAAGMLPFFNGIVNSMVQNSGPDTSGFTATVNGYGTAVHVMIYTIIGLGIVMVIVGVWLGRNVRKS